MQVSALKLHVCYGPLGDYIGYHYRGCLGVYKDFDNGVNVLVHGFTALIRTLWLHMLGVHVCMIGKVLYDSSPLQRFVAYLRRP